VDSPGTVSGLCPECTNKAEKTLEAVMAGTMSLHQAPETLASWWYSGDSFAWIMIREEIRELFEIADTLIREREKQRLRAFMDWPSFPRLCEARGEPWRIVPHTRELDSIMARLEQLGAVKS